MAQTQIYLRKAQLCIKEESSQDTFEAPAGDGTGIILAENVVVSYESNDYMPAYIRGDSLSQDEISGPISSSALAVSCRWRWQRIRRYTENGYSGLTAGTRR